jgi:hypothetical protein
MLPLKLAAKHPASCNILFNYYFRFPVSTVVFFEDSFAGENAATQRSDY